MSRAKSVKTNFIYSLAYQVLLLILPLVTMPYLSRVLGADGYGEYSYSYSVAYYFVLIAMLGVNNYGTRSVARHQGLIESISKEFWSIVWFQGLFSAAVLAVYIGYSVFMADNLAVAAAWIPYVVSAGLDINWLFFGLEEFKVTVTRNFVIKLASFILIFILVKGENALLVYCLIMSLSFLVSVLALWPFLKGRVRFSKPTWEDVRIRIKPNLVLFVPVIAVSLYTVLGKVMLGQLSTYEQTAFFDVVLRIEQVPLAFISALGTVMLPRSANLLSSGNSEKARRYLGSSMWLAMSASFLFTFGIIGVSDFFAPLFWGDGFLPCAFLLVIASIEIPFMAWANVLRTQYLIPAGKDRAYTLSVLSGAGVSVVLNFILIPRCGALGAVCAIVAAEATVCLVQVCTAIRELPQKQWAKESAPSFLIGIAMLILLEVVKIPLGETVPNLVLLICAGALFFAVLLTAYCVKTDNAYFNQLVRGTVDKAFRSLKRG